MSISGIKIIKRYFQSDFVKHVLILFSGSVISQLIPLIILPILTRKYTEAEFGAPFLYISIISVISIIATLKYEIAIVLPRNEKSAVYLVVFSFVTSFVLAFILYMLIIFGKAFFIKLIDTDEVLGNWIYFIPISVFFMGITQTGNFLLNRISGFKTISSGKVIKSFSTSSAQTAAAFSSGFIKSIGLVLGVITGHILHGIFILYKILSLRIFKDFNFSIKRMRKIAWYYREIPMFNTISGIINMISNNLPIFLFSSLYGINAVGTYGMTMRFTLIPIGIIASAVGEVYYSRAGKLYNENRQEFVKFTYQTTFKVIKFSIIPFLLAFIFVPQLFSIILGEEWIESGKFAQIILPWLFLLLTNSHLTSLITILKKQQQYLLFSFLFLLFRIGALYLGSVYYNNIYFSVLFYSIIGFVFNVFLLMYFMKINKALLKIKK